MSRPILVLMVFGGMLAGCSPEPRAATYFKAHPDEIAKVLADCMAGSHRGPECDNAQAAKAQIDTDARMALYKKSF